MRSMIKILQDFFWIIQLVQEEARSRCESLELWNWIIFNVLFELLLTFGPEVMCDMNWPISMFSILNLSLSLKSGTSTEAHPEQILKKQIEL